MIPILGNTATIAAVLGLLIGGAGSWVVQGWRYDAALLKDQQTRAAAVVKAEDKANTAAETHEQVKVQIEYRDRVVQKKVVEYIDRPVYKNVCIDQDGLDALNELIRQ